MYNSSSYILTRVPIVNLLCSVHFALLELCMWRTKGTSEYIKPIYGWKADSSLFPTMYGSAILQSLSTFFFTKMWIQNRVPIVYLSLIVTCKRWIILKPDSTRYLIVCVANDFLYPALCPWLLPMHSSLHFLQLKIVYLYHSHREIVGEIPEFYPGQRVLKTMICNIWGRSTLMIFLGIYLCTHLTPL